MPSAEYVPQFCTRRWSFKGILVIHHARGFYFFLISSESGILAMRLAISMAALTSIPTSANHVSPKHSDRRIPFLISCLWDPAGRTSLADSPYHQGKLHGSPLYIGRHFEESASNRRGFRGSRWGSEERNVTTHGSPTWITQSWPSIQLMRSLFHIDRTLMGRKSLLLHNFFRNMDLAD